MYPAQIKIACFLTAHIVLETSFLPISVSVIIHSLKGGGEFSLQYLRQRPVASSLSAPGIYGGWAIYDAGTIKAYVVRTIHSEVDSPV